MGHFINFDWYFCRIVALDFPAFGTHVARAEEGDRAVTFTDNDAVIDGTERQVDGCVDGDVKAGGGGAGFAVVIAVEGLVSV